MAFIRHKGRKDYGCFYVVENRRENGKVKQTVLACLGNYPSVAVAIEKLQDDVKLYTQLANKTDFRVPSFGRIRGMVIRDHYLISYFAGAGWKWMDIVKLYEERAVQL